MWKKTEIWVSCSKFDPWSTFLSMLASSSSTSPSIELKYFFAFFTANTFYSVSRLRETF